MSSLIFFYLRRNTRCGQQPAASAGGSGNPPGWTALRRTREPPHWSARNPVTRMTGRLRQHRPSCFLQVSLNRRRNPTQPEAAFRDCLAERVARGPEQVNGAPF